MRYALGVDGGGSKTVCLVADEQGRLLGYGRGGAVNTNYVDRGEAVHNLRCAIEAALAQAGLRGSQVEIACMSVPMVPDTVEEAAAACDVTSVIRAAEGDTPRWAARFWVRGHVGVTVDAGTGSLARGWSREGAQASAGGWGATLGDEGSGHWISMQAMVAVLQAYDGRIPPTALTEPVLAYFDMSNVFDMVFQVSLGLVRVNGCPVGVIPDSGGGGADGAEAAVGGVFFRERAHSGPLTRYEVASLCPVVVDVARRGDEKAIEILERAGVELGRAGVAVIQRLEMESERFAVVPFGGVFKAGELVKQSFRETILSAAPGARVVEPTFEPVVGAMLLALDGMGVAIDDRVIESVERSSSDFPVRRGGA